MTTVQITVNQQALLENLRYAFTGEKAVLRELAQNARRAGATDIRITYDDEKNTLQITDDGCGIDDFGSLLSVANSGWGDDIKAIERPYGMGFLCCLYAAEHVEVHSKGRCIKFDPKHALELNSIDVQPSNISKTVVILEGFAWKDSSPRCIEDIFSGFPTAVYYNGTPVTAKHRRDGDYVETAVGHIRLAKEDWQKRPLPIFYLQGFPIGVDQALQPRLDREATVVHLDPTRFFGVIPARELLQNPALVLEQVRKAIHELKLSFLVSEKARLSPANFVQTYTPHCMRTEGALNLLDDAPLPVGTVYRVEDIPYFEPEQGLLACCTIVAEQEVVAPEDVRNAWLLSCDVLRCAWPDDEDTRQGILAAAAAKYSDMVFVSDKLSTQHWARKNMYTFDSATIESVRESGRQKWSGHWQSGEIIACDSIKITMHLSRDGEQFVHQVEFDDCAVNYCGDIYVPHGCEIDFDTMRLGSDYAVDSHFEENDVEQERETASVVLMGLRSSSPHAMFTQIVDHALLRHAKALHGKSFVLTVNQTGEIKVESATIS